MLRTCRSRQCHSLREQQGYAVWISGFAYVYKSCLQVVVLIVAGLGKFTLWGAVLVDVGTALAVILNGMTLLRWRIRQEQPHHHNSCLSARACSSAEHSGNTPCCSSEAKEPGEHPHSEDYCGANQSTMGEDLGHNYSCASDRAAVAESSNHKHCCGSKKAAVIQHCGHPCGSEARAPGSVGCCKIEDGNSCAMPSGNSCHGHKHAHGHALDVSSTCASKPHSCCGSKKTPGSKHALSCGHGP